MRVSFTVPGTSRFRDRHIRIKLATGEALTAASVLIAALLALLLPDLGSGADLSYYGTLAQVIPVFLVAAALESRARLTSSINGTATTLIARAAELREMKKMLRAADLTPADRKEIDGLIDSMDGTLRKYNGEFSDLTQFARRLLRSYVLLAVPGEVAAIGALAVGHGGPFVFVLPALSVVCIGLLWTTTLATTEDLELDLEADEEHDAEG